MSKSLFSRLYLILSLFILTIFFVNYYFTMKTYREHQILLEKEKLSGIISSLKTEILQIHKNPALLKKIIDRTGASFNVRITIIETTGKVLSDTNQFPELMENHLMRPEIKEASYKNYGFSIRYSTTIKREMLYVAEKESGIFEGYIRVSVFLSDINSFLNVFKKDLFIVAFILLVLSLAGSYFLTRLVAGPLEKLTQVTDQIAAGNFDVMIPDIGSGEIANLANNFRLMTKKIKTLFQNISHQKEELSNIIDAIHEKLIVIDSRGIIVSANKRADEITQTKELVGLPFKNIIQIRQISEIIDLTMETRTGFMEEVIVNDKVYLCSSAFMPDIEETVIVMRDISELKNLENIKRNLIANVSHELRTPLTAIKGFLETLKDDLEGQNKKYLEIIERHTDRLIFIVQDLLVLSRLEDQSILPQYQKLKLKDIINDTFLLLEKKAKQKNLPLRFVEDEDIIIEADHNQLVQLFINIIDNAIKYTEKGEITVSLKKENDSARIDIQDTGIGVEKKHVPRLIERFYVVDSSRSRSQGGTGLGLSIVKHVVNNHKGKVEILSAPGQGTRVRITLPLWQNSKASV